MTPTGIALHFAALSALALIPFGAFAQSVSAYAGLAAALDGSSDQQIDTFSSGRPFTTPELSGAFIDLGGSVAWNKALGVGADIAWRAAHGAYTGIQYMPIFYNFDAIYEPLSGKRFDTELHGGIGGMTIRYSMTQQECDPLTGCTAFRSNVASSNHFQLHFAAAVRFYVTNRVFLRPAFDGHFVNNLYEFGSDFVPEFSLGLGYSFRRE